MRNLTQITLTDRERWLLAQLMAVASSFLASVYSNVPMDSKDVEIVGRLKDCAGETEDLVKKLNLDRNK